MYDAYRNKLMVGNENVMQAQINYNLQLIAHTIAQSNSKNPKPYNSKPEDFMFKPRVSARKEAEDWINSK